MRNIILFDIRSMWVKTTNQQPIYWVIMLIAAILVGITAVNSVGFYHADEHYQIIEFAGWKLGTHELGQLPWEFNHRIRPTLQPTMAWLIIEFCQMIGLENPHQKMFVLRLLSGLTSLLIITHFIRSTSYRFKFRWPFWILVGTSYFLWFMPFLSVRFSSETWSGLMFLLAISFWLKEQSNKYDAIVIGFLFGLSFLFRFQMGLAILGFGVWVLIQKNTRMADFWTIVAVTIGVVGLGSVLDSWFYGEWVFTPWNYVAELFRSKGEGFGASPWYAYVEHLWKWPSAPIALIVSLSLTIVFRQKNHQWLLWCIIPFVFVHTLIPHKELRFFFPLAFLIPTILAAGASAWLALNIRQKTKTVMLSVLLSAIAVINLPGLLVFSSKPAGPGYATITEYIDEEFGEKKVNLICAPFANPYDPWVGVPMKQYVHPDMKIESIHNLCELDTLLKRPHRINLLVYRRIEEYNPECNRYFQAFKTKELTSTLPGWMESGFYGFLDEEDRWNELILCRLD